MVFELTIRVKPFTDEKSWGPKPESFLTTVIVDKKVTGSTETYVVNFKDIGLQSEFGEYFILKKDGIWMIGPEGGLGLMDTKWSTIRSLELFHINS